MGGESAFEEELDLESWVDRPVESQVEVVIVVDLDFDVQSCQRRDHK